MIERKRPLPVGRYWVDVFESNKNLPIWFGIMGQIGAVEVEHTEHFDPIDGAEARDFCIFRVLREAVWPDDELGGVSPNVAGPEVRSSADTVDRPEKEKDPLDNLPSIGGVASAVKAFAAGAGCLVAVVLVALVSRARRR